ncbi:putative lipid II flippase FtsW [Verrucomicrobiota bacterium]
MWKTPIVLIVIVLVLMAFGIVMLASTSGVKALTLCNDPHYFVKRQILWLILALLTGTAAGKLDYHRWRDMSGILLIGAVVLLALVLVPGIGVKIGGSRRWLHVGPMSVQPSEVGKFSLIVILAWWMSREQRHVREFVRGALIPAILMGAIVLLVFAEPDFGTALLSAAVGISILFVGGSRIAHLVSFATLGLCTVGVAVMHDPVRMRRILGFLDPEKYAQTYSFQLVNAIDAFIAGGNTGVGLGESMQKQFYLPEAHTDFIFAIIGEELGVGATLAVVLLFGAIFVCGLRISVRAPDMFGRLLAFGITMMITAQAVMNMGVVTGCLPTKGLPLPFISFGGSCLVMSALGIGILVNIAEQGLERFAEDDIRAIQDRFENC